MDSIYNNKTQNVVLEWYAKNGVSFNKELMNDVSLSQTRL